MCYIAWSRDTLLRYTATLTDPGILLGSGGTGKYHGNKSQGSDSLIKPVVEVGTNYSHWYIHLPCESRLNTLVNFEPWISVYQFSKHLPTGDVLFPMPAHHQRINTFMLQS